MFMVVEGRLQTMRIKYGLRDKGSLPRLGGTRRDCWGAYCGDCRGGSLGSLFGRKCRPIAGKEGPDTEDRSCNKHGVFACHYHATIEARKKFMRAKG